MRAFFIPNTSWRDTAALAVALLTLNFLFSRHNLGWWELQPTPYVLLPVIIGARHGIGAGIVAGLAAFLAPITGQAIVSDAEWHAALAHHWEFLAGAVLLGIVCGEFQSEAQRRFAAQTNRVGELEKRLKEAGDTVACMREGVSELERLKASREREQSMLDTGLRWLSASGPNQMGRNLLCLLNRQAHVTDAALYYSNPMDGTLHREALLGREDRLPPRIAPLDLPMVQATFEHKEPATVPELRELMHGEVQDYLASLPLLNSRGEPFGLVLVTGIPVAAFTPKTHHVLEFICRCASTFIEVKDRSLGHYRLVEGLGENCRIYLPHFFHHLVRNSAEAFEKQQVLATLVLLCAPNAPASFQPELERTLMRNLRAGDYAAQLELEIPHLVVLLPVTGESGALALIERARASWPQPEYRLDAYSLALEQSGDLEALLAQQAAGIRFHYPPPSRTAPKTPPRIESQNC